MRAEDFLDDKPSADSFLSAEDFLGPEQAPSQAPAQRRRGGLRSEARPFVAGETSDPNIGPPAPEDISVLDKGPTNQQANAVWDSLSPDEQKRRLALRQVYDSRSAAPDLKAAPERGAVQRALDSTVRKPMDNSVQGAALETLGDAARGTLMASQRLGGSAWGAVQAGAEAAGMDGIAGFAGSAGSAARQSANQLTNPADPGSLTQQVFESTFTSLPLALAFPGGGALAAMGAQSAANEYGESRDRGMSPNASLERAAYMGITEMLGERVGLPQLQTLFAKAATKASNRELGHVLADLLVKEQVGEQATTALQDAYEKFSQYGTKPNMTLADYLDDVANTAKVTLGQSLLGGGGASIVKAAAPAKAGAAREIAGAIDSVDFPASAGTGGPTPSAEAIARSKGFLSLEQMPAEPLSPEQVLPLARKAGNAIDLTDPESVVSALRNEQPDVRGASGVASGSVPGGGDKPARGVGDVGSVAADADRGRAGVAAAPVVSDTAPAPVVAGDGSDQTLKAESWEDKIRRREAERARQREALSRMTPDQVDAAFDAAREHNKAVELDVLRRSRGDAFAQEFSGWSQRKRDRWFQEEATPEEDDAVQERYQPDELIAEYRNTGNFDDSSPEALGRSLSMAMSGFGQPGWEHSPEGATVRNALAYAIEKGWDESKVISGLRARVTEVYGNDAPELFSALFKKKPESSAPMRSFPSKSEAIVYQAENRIKGVSPVKVGDSWQLLTKEDARASRQRPVLTNTANPVARDLEKLRSRSNAALALPQSGASTTGDGNGQGQEGQGRRQEVLIPAGAGERSSAPALSSDTGSDGSEIMPEPIEQMRQRWPGAATKSDEFVRAIDASYKAGRRLLEATGNHARGKAIEDQLAEESGGLMQLNADLMRGGEPAQIAYQRRLAERLQAEAARIDAERSTPGTLENARRNRDDRQRADETTQAMHRAAQQEIEASLQEARDLYKHNRLTADDINELGEIARTAPDSFETAYRLQELLKTKAVQGYQGSDLARGPAANDKEGAPAPADPAPPNGDDQAVGVGPQLNAFGLPIGTKFSETEKPAVSRSAQTDTPEFAKWFGKSKVVDPQGKPLVVYHGTNKTEHGDAFTMFDSYGSNYGLFGQGAYFTENPAVASSYTTKGKGSAPTVYSAFMRLSNPIDMDAPADPAAWRDAYPDLDIDSFHEGGSSNESYYRAAEAALADQEVPKYEGAEVMQEGLRRMGFDGITHIGGGRVKSDGVKHRVYIAFDPEQIKSATGNNGAFDPANPDIRFKRGDGKSGLTRPAVEIEVAKLTAKWSNAPKIVVVDSMADESVPEAVRQEDAGQRSQGASGDPEGFAYQGTVYLVAPQLATVDDVRRVLFHEALGHFGLRGVFGKNLVGILNDVAASRPREIMEVSRLYGLDPKKDSRVAAEEVLANLAQKNPELSLVRRAVAAIRTWLREHGINTKLSDDEIIRNYLEPARRFVEAGGKSTGSDSPRFSRNEKQAQTGDATAVETQDRGENVGGDIALNDSAAPGGSGDIRFSRAESVAPSVDSEVERPAYKDALGYYQLPGGEALYKLAGKAAIPILDKLGMRPMSKEMRSMQRMMRVEVQKAMETASAAAKELAQLTPEERSLVSDIIEREVQSGIVPPAHAVRIAGGINAIMEAQTNELVRLGMLSKETADRWRGQYLPRFYTSKLSQAVDPWVAAVNKMRSKPSALSGIKGKSLMGRGLYETVPAKELEQYLDLGWEVRDDSYDPATSTEVGVWRDFTREEREKMGEIRDAQFRLIMGYMRTQKDIALGKMFEGIASNPEMSSKGEREGWVRVPDTTIPNTDGVKRYGLLGGRWVPKDTFSHLSKYQEADNEALQMYRKILSAWKESKTVLNPVAHANNVMGNLSMAHFAGVSYWDAHKYAGAILDLSKRAPMVKEAHDAGLFGGTFSAEDLQKMLPDDLAELAKQQKSNGGKAASFAFNAMSFFLRKPMGIAYEAEDQFFRYLIYRDARSRGLSPDESVDYATRFIFSYDELPSGARKIRDFGLPFFSYTFMAAPSMLHTAITHPHRFLAPASVLWGINAGMYAMMAGGDDEDWLEKLKAYINDPARREKASKIEEEERKHLPPWMKGSTALMTPKAIRLGMDELTGLPLFMDTSRIVPMGDIFDVSPNSSGIPWPQPLTPNHPVLTTFAAMFSNKDLFTGKDLVDVNDTSGEAAEKRAQWIWKQLAPAIAIGNYHWERGMQAYAQATGGVIRWYPNDITGVGKDGVPVQPKYAAMQTFGLKVRPIDLEASEQIEDSMRKKMIRDIDAEIRRLRMLNKKGAVSDRQLDDEMGRAIDKKDRLREGLNVNGE